MLWSDLQAEFVESLRDPELQVPDGVGLGMRNNLQTKRFNVYRNNVAVGLTENLAASYPVTKQLVGEEFFTGMARVFVDLNAPRSPVMLHYGEHFPEFISDFEPAQSLPFLADVASIERCWNQAYNALDASPVGIESLQEVAPDLMGMQCCNCTRRSRLLDQRGQHFPSGICTKRQMIPQWPCKNSHQRQNQGFW